MTKHFTFLFSLLLLLASLAFSQPCQDNCEVFAGNVGTCGACHNISGYQLDQNPGGTYPGEPPSCSSCGAAISASPIYRPIVPLSTGRYDLVGLVDALRPKPQVALHRLMDLTPEHHVELMQAALKSRRDGTLLGKCKFAFKPGSLALMTAEIAATKKRILSAGLITVR